MLGTVFPKPLESRTFIEGLTERYRGAPGGVLSRSRFQPCIRALQRATELRFSADGLQRTKQRTTTPPASAHNPNSCHPGAKRRTYALCLRHHVYRVHPVHCRRPAGAGSRPVLTVLKRFCSWGRVGQLPTAICSSCSPGTRRFCA